MVGYFFYFTALALPFVILYLCHLKTIAPFMHKSQEVWFDQNYDFLYKGFKTRHSGLYHYYFVYIMRRFVFVNICMGLYQPEYATLQIFVNIWLSVGFMLYLAHYKPFFDERLN